MPTSLEILTLFVSTLVIIIETIIIFLLYRHQKALDKHLLENENLTKKFERNIEKHLEHINAHSHKIEKKLESICGTKM